MPLNVQFAIYTGIMAFIATWSMIWFGKSNGPLAIVIVGALLAIGFAALNFRGTLIHAWKSATADPPAKER